MINDFAEAAPLYDRIFDARGKDYAAEASAIAEVIRAGFPSAKTLLDVACGTGRHLAYFAKDFSVAGIDRDPLMLARATSRMRGIALHEADMRSFTLEGGFDAITCLFGSIAYLQSATELTSALHCFHAHLPSGGMLVIEPFVTPSEYVVGDVALVTIDEPGMKISRAHVSERTGDFAVLDHHFMVAEPSGVRYFVERHRLRLFDEATMLEALAEAGFEAERKRVAPFRQELYVARAR